MTDPPVIPPPVDEAAAILFQQRFYKGFQTYFDVYRVDSAASVIHIASPKGGVVLNVKYDPALL